MSEKVVIEDPETTASPWSMELLKGLNDMRSSSVLCDVVINTNDNKYYSVHSAVLGAGSPFFSEILNQSKMSGAGIVIKLEKPSTLVEALITFLYTGTTTLDAENLEAFKIMADGYNLSHLTKLCTEKQYLMTLGNLVKVTENVGPIVMQGGKIQQDLLQTEVDEQVIMACEEEDQQAVESVEQSLDAVEVEMDSLTKAIGITEESVGSFRPVRRTYNTGGPKKTWRDYKYNCQFCGKVFTSLSRMQGHQALHTGDKRHVCNICGQKFIQIEYLREHVSIHSTTKPFKCDLCGQSFRLGRHLKKHQRSHNEDKNFECDLCHKKFKRSTGLIQHMMIHNGEKPYECNQCKRMFRHKEALHRHKNAVHSANSPFRCGFCEAGFSQLSGLKDHRNHCRANVIVCKHCNKTFQTAHTLNRHIQLKHPGKPSNYKKVGEEEVQRAALRTKEVEESEMNPEEEEEEQTEVIQSEEADQVNAEVEQLLGQEYVVDQDTSEIILQSLEKGIVLQGGEGGLEIQTDEDGQMVYQVLTLQMGDEEGTTVLTTAPMLEADEVSEIPTEDS